MSNSIDKNLEGNNSMSSLSFHWLAEFDHDGILQFDQEVEHGFQEVLDRIKDLKFFHLYNRVHRFIVDLEKGLIKYNDIATPNEIEAKYNIRLIYFRRHRIQLNESDLKEQAHTIEYHLGFQYNDKLGNNRQTVLIIDNQGNWVLGE